jgi:hypothetical protein
MSVKLILTEGAVMSSEVTSHNNMEWNCSCLRCEEPAQLIVWENCHCEDLISAQRCWSACKAKNILQK